MLYFIGYEESQDNWTGNFTEAVQEELVRRSIPFRLLPPYNWRGPSMPLREYLRIESRDDDQWFFSWAHSPLIELLAHKKGRKYGLVVGVTTFHFDPLIFVQGENDIRESHRLSLYDKIFTVSHWCKRCVLRAYPFLKKKVVHTGFPHDFDIYEPYKQIAKEPDLIVFNQRFALERLPVLELEIARMLIKCGFRVQHLTGTDCEIMKQQSPSMVSLLCEAEQIGLNFIHNATKDQYHRNLAKASVVITTAIADMLPASLIEAIYLGAIPIAPRAFCFPEFVHYDNLYAPYDLREIIALAEMRPKRHHTIKQFSKETVVDTFIREMGLG
ncbi:MAG: hypothetical protein KGZ63_06140 [Clostridiales bacterium]|jgi:hypothetical protein|nr:hypothetical protein [Clostridiales bacterium]